MSKFGFSCKHLEQDMTLSMDVSKQKGHCTYNVTLTCVRVTIFTVEKVEVLQISSVCL